MKFAKLSLAALAVVGFSSSAMALDLSGVTAKPYVNTKLYYETIDGKGRDALQGAGANNKLFNKNSATGQALAQVGVTGNFNSCWGYGLEYSVADTLGLEGDVVSGVRMGTGRTSTLEGDPGVNTQDWMSQAYVTFKGCGTPLKNTTFKIGRQYLDTPLAFTETWNLAPNSFDAIVAANTDIQNVTLIGAYVGKGNGAFGTVTNGDRFVEYPLGATFAPILNSRGAYALAALTNFGIPVNVWYYNVREVAKAVWADTNFNIMGAKLGLQYGNVNPSHAYDRVIALPGNRAVDTTKGGAIQLSGNIAGFHLSAAYSKVDDNTTGGQIALANTATGGKKTKLYTAGIYTDGTGVAIPGSKAYRLAASTNTAYGKFTLAYIDCKNDMQRTTAATNVKETDFIWGTKVLGIDTKLILINRDVKNSAAAGSVGRANGLGDTLRDDTKHVRIILSKKF